MSSARVGFMRAAVLAAVVSLLACSGGRGKPAAAPAASPASSSSETTTTAPSADSVKAGIANAFAGYADFADGASCIASDAVEKLSVEELRVLGVTDRGVDLITLAARSL